MSIHKRRVLGTALAGLIVTATAASADTLPSPTLVSATGTGAAANGASGTFGLAASGTGRFVAFSSTAPDVVAGGSAVADVYVRDTLEARTVRASATASGEAGNGISTRPSLSADGSRVAFLSSASNLDAEDRDGRADVYVKDLVTGTVRVVSTSGTGQKANGASGAVTLSADVRAVAFVSTATNLDPGDADSLPDVYVKDLSTGSLTLVSVTAEGSKGRPGDFGVGSLSLSEDGTRVAFTTDASLSDEDTNDRADVYVKDLTCGGLELASATADGAPGDGPSVDPMLTADGREVIFSSSASTLDRGDRDPDSDVYVKDLSTGALTLVSANEAGTKGDGPTTTPAISGDGRLVAFASKATNLGPQPADPPQLDVYTKDLSTGEVKLAAVAGDGTRADAPSLYPALSADGSRVAFATPATNLSPEDGNGTTDVYLAEAPEPDPTDAAPSHAVRRAASGSTPAECSEPTPSPSPEPTPESTEPPPSPEPTPESTEPPPSPEPTPESTEPPPSPEPTPESTEPPASREPTPASAVPEGGPVASASTVV